ncbi:AAA family ATPase [Lysobacter capsici]|uniref:AAA family ATPase n=1 Tax=Lysobacter capsici TaxID=435897 RepID=UPI00398D3F1E
MKLRLETLRITARKSIEEVSFSPSVTFLYGPVGTGKSTVARLVDYCLGGDLERTPAVQQEFVAAQLNLQLGEYACTLERSAADTQSVRVSWSRARLAEDIEANNVAADEQASEEGLDEDRVEEPIEVESVNAPLSAGGAPIFAEDVYNLSDLLFHLSGVRPIKVRQRARDPDSPMIRLSFRDIWWYCYLEQTHLDSSFFKLEDPFRGRKSQDAMRFFTGLHSERLSQLEADLYRAIDEQKGKREAASQIKIFMNRFELGSELDVESRIEISRRELKGIEAKRQVVERDRATILHPTDQLRTQLRELGSEVAEVESAIGETTAAISEQRALRAELITAKVKSTRAEQAGAVLAGVSYVRCPQCFSDVSARPHDIDTCSLCCSQINATGHVPSLELESMRRELNDRIDLIGDSIQRRERGLGKNKRLLERLRCDKSRADDLLQAELARYDSSFIESIRR